MSVRRAAEAAHRRSRRTAERMNTRPRYAVITSLDPLEADLTGTTLTLDDDDLILCQQVRIYDRDFGLAEGDSLVVTEMENGDWVASAVISSTDIPSTEEP